MRVSVGGFYFDNAVADIKNGDIKSSATKIEYGDGAAFFLVESVGEGKTLVLSGAAVVTTGKIVRFQEGIIDMTGPGADYTPYSRTCNVVVILENVEGVDKHDFETACRMAGLKAAAYLAEKCLGTPADEVETYETPCLKDAMAAHPGLPKVAYLYMLQSQGLLHDTYLYGVDVKKILPTFLNPTEVMDGAIVSGNCVSACDKNNTYSHQNNPVIHHMFRRHGKDFNFLGCIVTNENVTLADKKRCSSYSIKLAKTLGVDGLLISEEGFGNPDADLIMNCWKAERAGIKTTLLTDEYAGQDGASQSLADSCPEGDACVTAGNANEVIVLPPMKKVIGVPEEANIIAGGWQGSLAADGTITWVSSQPEFTPTNVQTRDQRVRLVFEFRVQLPVGTSGFLPGQPVDVALP